MNTEKVKIQFEASATGLKNIYEQIKQIKDAPNINLDEKLLGQLKDLDNKVPALVKKIKDTMASDFTIGDIQVLDSEFKQLVRLYESALTNLGRANLPAVIQEQISKATKEVEKAQNQLDRVNSAIRKKQQQLDESSTSGLNKKATGEVDKQFISQFEIKDQKFGNFEQYAQAYDKLSKAMQLTDEEQLQFLQTQAKVEEAYKQRIATIKEEIDIENAKIPALQKAVEDGERYVQNLKEQAIFSENLSDAEKEVTAAILSASQAITKAKTDEKNAIRAATEKTKEDTKQKEENTKAQKENTSTVAKAAKQVFTYGTVLGAFRKIYRTVINTITEMDKALTGMAVVTNMSREQTWGLVGTFQALAKETGKTTSEIADMATKFFQQGKSLTQVEQLTRAAAKAATIAGIDGSRSIDLLTNAMNGFQVSASRAMEVSDKFAALAASAATDYEELATALSKVAAQANLAGMSMDFTLGLLTKGIEVTREAPETIGTALKTVIARMRELTDYGATLEDGIDINRVAKALANIGVELMDEEGQFRDLDTVLTEVGKKWDTLNKNQQANVAVALAGTRQQSRLIAMMQDFDRTLELVDISANSYGATLAQSEKYMGGLQAAQANLTTSFQGLITSLTDSKLIIGVVDILSGIVSAITWITDQAWIMIPLIVIITGNLLRSLEIKLQEKQAQKEINALELENTKTKKEQRKIDIKARIASLDKQKNALKELKTLDKQTEEKIKQYKLDAEASGNAALAAYYQQLLTEEKKDDLDTSMALQAIELEKNALKAEDKLLSQEITNIEMQQVEHAELLNGIIGKTSTGLAGFLSILSIIPGIIKLIIGLRKKEGVEIDKNTAKEKKGLSATIASALANTAKKAPWFIAIALLAAAGVAIAAAAGAFKSKEEKTDDSIAKTREGLDQLQADLYNLDTARQNVSKLGDEFDSLSSKVIKTSEDIERMNEIVQSVNDQAGREIVDVAADTATQLAQIKGYELSLERERAKKVEDINETLAEGYKDVAYDTYYVQGTKYEEFDQEGHDAYMKALKTDSSFVSSIRTIGKQSLPGLDDVSTGTSDAILDMLVDNIDQAFDKDKGVDVAKFQNLFGGKQEFQTFATQLDKTMEKGTFDDYLEMFNSVDKAQQKLLAKSIPMFKAIQDMGAETAEKFKTMSLTAKEMNTVMGTLNNLTELGAEVDISSATNREELYKTLVQAQKDAQLGTSQALQMSQEELEAKTNRNAYEEKYLDILKKKKEAEEKIAEEENKKYSDQEKLDKYQTELGEATLAEEDFKKAAYESTATIEEFKTLLGTVSVSEIIDDLTKMSSAIERVSKVTDLANLSLKEQMELLADYPELLAAMEKGYLTAGEAYDIFQKQVTTSMEDAQTAQKNFGIVYGEGTTDVAASSGWGQWSDMFTENGADLRAELIAKSSLSGDDAFVKMLREQKVQELIASGIAEEEARKQYGIGDALAAAQKIQADAKEYNNYSHMISQYEKGDIAAFMSESEKEAWNNAKNVVAANRAKIDSYTEELETLEKGSEEYKAVYQARQQALIQSLKDSEAQTADIQARINNILGVGTDKDLSAYVNFVDGVAYLNEDMTKNLSQEQRNQLALVIKGLNAQGEAYEKENKRRKEDQEALAQSIIDSEAKILEAQIENLEKRKEAYEKYFDEMDAMEEEQERSATMQDISSQLAALAGGSDAATNSLRKELMSQMEDLRKEEEQARKEAAREALIEDIDSQIEATNEQLDTVNNSLNKIIALIANPDYKMQIDDNGNITVIDKEGKNVLPFANGGLVDYTGPAIVHGTPGAPEAFLSAQDTKNMQLLFAALNDVVAKSTAVNVSGEGSGANNISIDSINIHTNELNNNQDFRTAGQIFAEEFGKAIKQRGLNINVRK